MSVAFSAAAFRKAGLARRGGIIEFRPSDAATIEGARSALQETVEHIAERIVLDEGWQAADIDVSAGPAVISHDSLLIPVRSIIPPSFVADFLDLVAHGLEERGIAGKLTPAKHVLDHHFESTDIPTLSTALRLPIDLDALFRTWDPKRKACAPGWYATVEDSSAVLEPMLAWVTEIGGATTISFNGTTIAIEPSAAWPMLGAMLRGQHRISIQVKTASSKRQMRSLTCNNFGWAAAASYDDEQRDALAQITMMTKLLRTAAPHVLCGWVRPSSTLSTHVVPGTDLLTRMGGTTAQVAHLEADWLHDVFAVQLVSSAALARIPTTDGWLTENIGGGKHLLRTNAPEEWFDTNPLPYDRRTPPYQISTGPTVRTKDEARAAFDAILVKPSTLAERPPPVDAHGQAT